MKMTGRERMMAACKGQEIDRIPVSPDISNYIPCEFTKKPFWDIYINENPSLWQAYISAVKRLGIDGWFLYSDLKFEFESKISYEYVKPITKNDQYWDREKIVHTPDGDLTEIIRVYKNDPPTRTKKMIVNLEKDYKKLKHLFSKVKSYDSSVFMRQKKSLGELGMMVVDISLPGFPTWLNYFDGDLEALTYAYFDFPDIFEELKELHHNQSVSMVEKIIEFGEVDSILFGFSGGITLQSPDIFDKLSFPTIQKVSSMCKQAGVISGLHSCGKEYHIVKRCAEEIDLDYINPLEISPMGDCILSEIVEQFGNKITLMGNLHTISIMLYGSVKDVRRESLKAIKAAGKNGRFILSTADQCGYGTPEENLKEMVRTVESFGTYPLDMDRIEKELSELISE